MTPKDCAVKCATCNFYALTASEQATESKAFIEASYQVLMKHFRETGHEEWRLIPAT